MNISHNSKHFLNILLLILMLVGINTNVWGYYTSHVNVYSSPENGGWVYVGTSNSQPGSYTLTSDNATIDGGKLYQTSGNNTFYLCNKPNAGGGYVFKGWATSEDVNTGEGANNNPFAKSVSGSSKTLGGTTHNFYAIFAKMTADKSSIAFGEKLVGLETDAVTITVSHAHAGSITAGLTAGNTGDFVLSKAAIANSVAEGTATFTVKFHPTAAGSRSATLTISSDNGLSSIDISLTGTGMSVVEPVYTCNIADEYFVDDASLDLESLWTSTSNGTKTYSIVSFTPSSANNTDLVAAPAITGNRTLSLGQAGTLVLSLSQEAISGYYEGEDAKTITISKRTPSFTWNAGGATYYYGSTIPSIFSTTGECAYTLISNNEYAANVIDNTLHIYNVEETAKITATQVENYKWNGNVVEYVVTPVNPNNHVPFTITSSNYNTPFHYNHNGSFSWNESGVQIGDGGGGFNYDDKYYDIAFTGIPDKLSFKYETTSGAATGVEWWVKESADGVNWTNSEWGTQTSSSGTASNIQLLPTTRYLRFCYSGNFGGRFKNIKVTELKRFWATPKPTLDFGTKGANYGVQEEQVTFLHANAGRITNVEIVGEDASFFSVSPTTVAGTGRDLYNTVYLKVRFDNGEELRGETPYVAKLRIYDYNGHKDSLTLTGIRNGKLSPEFTWNANHLPYYLGTTIANIASSSNMDYEHCPLSYSSSDPTIANVIDGVLHIYNKKQSVTITVSQPENEDFAAGSQDFVFTPRERPSLEVPFHVNKGIYNESIEAGSKCYWENDEDGRVRAGNTNIFVDDLIWKDEQKVFTLSFAGTPDKLSFEYRNNTSYALNSTSPGNGDYMWEVKESADGVTWNSIWHADSQVKSWKTVYDIPLNPTTQYIQFIFFGNYEGYWRNINVSSLEGFKYLRAADGKYLSRGNYWGTQAVVDNFGIVSRISRFTHNNTDVYTRFMFVDNMQYLYEADNHELFTDDGTAGNTDNLWELTAIDGTILTIQSGNDVTDSHKGQYITVNNGILALTTDETAATHWQMEDYSEHPAYITAMLDKEAAAAAAEDFGSDVNTLAEVRSKVKSEDFEFTDIPVPALALGEQKGEYRDGVAGTWAVMDETISGLEPGFYRLEIHAFNRVSSSNIAWACHDNNPKGMESVLAYVYANDVKYPIQSIYDSYSKTPLEPDDELHDANQYYPTTLASADKTFEPSLNRYVNDVYVYVNADEGKETGTLHYGIKNPSYVPNAWLAYENVKLTKIARKEYIFEGTESNDTDWETDKNWNRDSKPDHRHAVIIRHDIEIDEEVSVFKMTIENDAKVYVLPTGGLTIGAGGIKGATTENLILKAAQSGDNKGETGYLRISPYCKREMPQATVELFSIGYTDYELGLSNPMAWQYVGYPMVDSVKAKDIFDGWIYSWIEENGAWKNNRRKLILEPFTGYATTQDYEKEGLLMKFSGQLVNNGIVNIQLTNSGSSEMAGWNAVANSFVAPIDLTQMSTDDFSEGVDATIYLFNTGSTSNPTKGAGDAGQYVAIPINLVSEMSKGFSYPTVIPAMQGFFVQTENDGTLKLDYSRVVWNAKYDSNKNAPLRAPKHTSEEEQKGSLCVTMSANEMADNLYMMEAENYNAAYENGYDARKMNSGEFNIFAIEEDEHLAVDATNSIIGTHVGVRTGEATEYTFGFSRLNSENALALLDMEADQIIEINEGIEYTFFAEPNSTITDRFQIIEWDGAQIPGIATGVDNVDNVTKAHKFIKDNQLFILKNGVLYNATGVLVR